MEPKTVFLYPGQGTQDYIPEFTNILLDSDPLAKKTFEDASRALGKDMLELCLHGTADELAEPLNLQPSVVVVSLASKQVLDRRGIKADISIGHSLGEYSALTGEDVFSLYSVCRVVSERAQYMLDAAQEHPGGMITTIRGTASQIKKMCVEAGAQIAADNSFLQRTITGSYESLEHFKALVEQANSSDKVKSTKQKIRLLEQKIPYPAHSLWQKKVVKQMASQLSAVSLNDPTGPVISNRTAKYFADARQVRRDLAYQHAHTVHFNKGIQFAHQEGGLRYIEVGAGSILGGITKQILGEQVEILHCQELLAA